jgi:hypothetical protein
MKTWIPDHQATGQESIPDITTLHHRFYSKQLWNAECQNFHARHSLLDPNNEFPS